MLRRMETVVPHAVGEDRTPPHCARRDRDCSFSEIHTPLLNVNNFKENVYWTLM
jgi:hypothetical protein